MRHYFIILLIIFSVNDVFPSHHVNDSITINYYFYNDNFGFYIHNNTYDTILLINEFYFEGLTSNIIVYPISFYYYPNIIIFSSSNTKKFEGDGVFFINYYKLPEFIIIPPSSDKNFISNIYIYENLILKLEDFIGGYFRFAKKADLDKLFKNCEGKLSIEYNNSLNYSDNIIMKCFLSDSLIYKENNYEDSTCSINKIKNYFKIIY